MKKNGKCPACGGGKAPTRPAAQMTNSAPPAAMLYTYETDIIQNAIGAAAGGAAGTLAGPEGTVAGAVIGGVANVIDGCYEKVRK